MHSNDLAYGQRNVFRLVLLENNSIIASASCCLLQKSFDSPDLMNMRVFVTCAHCLYQQGKDGKLVYKQWAVIGKVGIADQGNFAYFDLKNDLALLFLKDSIVNEYYGNDGLLISNETLTLASTVEIFGYPATNFNGIYPDRINATVANLAGNPHISGSYSNVNHEIDANVHHGNSGGPLLGKASQKINGIIVTKSKIISKETEDIAKDANRFTILSVGNLTLGSILTRSVMEAQNNTHIGRGQAIPSVTLLEFINNPGDLYNGYNSYPQGQPTHVEAGVSVLLEMNSKIKKSLNNTDYFMSTI